MKITIKRYTHDHRWYVVNEEAGKTLYSILPNVDKAIEVVNREFPEAETVVVDDYKPHGR